MAIQIRTTGALFTGVLLMLIALPGTAFAVDGQIAITQAKAMAGGVTPGDAAGFPISINQPGSYVLSGNLMQPDADTDVIQINASHVTIELNGFAILGTTDCSGGSQQGGCAGDGNGNGISTITVQFNITIRNGTIQGMGRSGITLKGDEHLVEYVHVRSNGGAGIVIETSNDLGSSIAQYNTAQRNAGTGIFVDRGLVRNSVADVNFFHGIFVGVGSASNNVSTRNEVGIVVLPEASYFGNVLSGNATAVTGGGRNLGQNLCGAAVCPGAQF